MTSHLCKWATEFQFFLIITATSTSFHQLNPKSNWIHSSSFNKTRRINLKWVKLIQLAQNGREVEADDAAGCDVTGPMQMSIGAINIDDDNTPPHRWNSPERYSIRRRGSLSFNIPWQLHSINHGAIKFTVRSYRWIRSIQLTSISKL